MIELTLAEIAGAVDGKIVTGAADLKVSGNPDTDSRALEVGGIFFAKLGEHDDGHRYLEQVADVAALAVVSQPNAALALPQIQVEDTVVALTALAKFVLNQVRS